MRIGPSGIVLAACRGLTGSAAAKIAAIQSGHYDLSSNVEFVNLVKAKR